MSVRDHKLHPRSNTAQPGLEAMSPKPSSLSINSHHLPQKIPCMQLMLCLQRTKAVRLQYISVRKSHNPMETQCNYAFPVAPQSLSICQSYSTSEARGISGLFAIKHTILLPKGIFKDFFFSIEEPAFHPLPLKQPAQRSQKYLQPGVAAPKIQFARTSYFITTEGKA